MTKARKTPTSLQTGDAALVDRGGVPQMVVLKGGAVRDVGTGSGDLAPGDAVLPAIGNPGDVLTVQGNIWVPAAPTGGVTAIVKDTSPQLGGHLDRNGFEITGLVVGTNIQAHSAILDGTEASFTTAKDSKLTSLPDSMISAATGAQIRQAFEAVEAAGGSQFTLLAAIISILSTSGAGSADPASAAQHWAGTAGLYLATPQSLAAAEAMQTFTPSSGLQAIDGSLFFNAQLPAAATAVDFNALSNLTPRKRYVYVPANGGARPVTATGADLTSPSALSVSIPSGKTGRFTFYSDGSNKIVVFDGYTDSLVLPTALVGRYTLPLPAGSWRPRITNPAGIPATNPETATNKVNSDVLEFDKDADEFAWTTAWMPKAWDGGALTFKVLMQHPTATTNFSVTWAVRARVFASGDSLDQALGSFTRVVVEGDATSPKLIYSAESGTLTPAGTLVGDRRIYFEVSRDVDGNGTAGNDDLAVDALFEGLEIYYMTNAATDA